MAITWDTQITNVNINSKRGDVSFMRTDTATGETWSMRFTQALLETGDERAALLNAVWAEWQTEVAKQAGISTFLGTLEQSANANLMAREA